VAVYPSASKVSMIPEAFFDDTRSQLATPMVFVTALHKESPLAAKPHAMVTLDSTIAPGEGWDRP
jgi:hypothetical protein